MKFILQFLLLLSFLVLGQTIQAVVNTSVQMYPQTISDVIAVNESYNRDLISSEIAKSCNFEKKFVSYFGSDNKSVAKAAGSSFKIGDEIAGISIKQIRSGSNGKIAIIGRRMNGHVEEVEKALASQGKKVEVFNSKYQKDIQFDIDGKKLSWDDIEADFSDLSKYKRNDKGWILDEDLPNTYMFKANKQWADKLKIEGYEILDIGYPANVTSESVFYNMELNILFSK